MTILQTIKFKGKLLEHIHGGNHRQDTYWLVDGKKATDADFRKFIVPALYK